MQNLLPVYFGGFNEYRSVNGWIKLRKIKNYKDKNGYLVISGNFEFTARNEDGETIEITGGTFDGLYEISLAMKRISFIYLISAVLLTAVSYEDKFHMPFKETDEGADKASLYMDGVAMRSFHERGYLGMSERTTYSWADEYAYVFKSWIGAEGADYGGNSIMIDIRREFPEEISPESGTKSLHTASQSTKMSWNFILASLMYGY